MRFLRPVLCVLACFALWSTPASARPNLVGILSIDTKGVSDVAAEQFEAEVEDALEGMGMQSVDRASLKERLAGSEFLEGCFFGPCLRSLRAATGVPVVLVARIQGEGSNYSFVITLVDTETGLFTSQVSQTCAVCTIEEAISTATLSTISLLTGTGGARVNEASSDEPAPAELEARQQRRQGKSSLRRSGLIFLGTGVAAAAIGGLMWRDDRSGLGIAGVSTGAALVTGGGTMLLLSRRF